MTITQKQRIKIATLIDNLRHAGATTMYVQAGLSKRHLEVVERERLEAEQRLDRFLDGLTEE